MDRPNEGIAEAGENEAAILMTCSGGTSVIKDLGCGVVALGVRGYRLCGELTLIVSYFVIGICGYMGREWELSYRLEMRPWIAVAYSAPVIAATAVFVVYPIGHARVRKPEKALRCE